MPRLLVIAATRPSARRFLANPLIKMISLDTHPECVRAAQEIVHRSSEDFLVSTLIINGEADLTNPSNYPILFHRHDKHGGESFALANSIEDIPAEVTFSVLKVQANGEELDVLKRAARSIPTVNLQ